MRYLVSDKSFDGFKNVSLDYCISYFKRETQIAVDTETRGFFPQTGELLTIQLGNSKDQFVIDATYVDIYPLKTILEGKTIFLHYAKFDLRWLFYIGIYPFNNVFDTFLAERVLTCGLDRHKRSLDACVYRYLGITLSKEIRSSIYKLGLTKEVAEYAADDVKYLIDIAKQQAVKLRAANLEKCLALDNAFVSVLAYVENCGMYLDQKQWKLKMDEDLLKFQHTLDYLDHFAIRAGYSINDQGMLFPHCDIDWSSPLVVGKLFTRLGINILVEDKKTKKLKPSVEAPVLKPQADKFPIIKPYLEYKAAQKEVSTYGATFLKLANHFSDGRLRTIFTQILNTGRMSSGGRIDGMRTVNFQNIPREGKARPCFIPKEGNVFVIGDYSQQEQVILANKSKDDGLIKFFQSGSGDMHSFVASKMYEELEFLTAEEIKTHHADKRQLAKSAGFAINYGGTGYTIASNLILSIEDGERIYSEYMNAFPGLKDYFSVQEKDVFKRGYILINNITGRKTYLPNYRQFQSDWYSIDWSEYKEHKLLDTDYFKDHLKPKISQLARVKSSIRKKALNYPIQGTGADMVKVAGIKLFNWIKQNGYLEQVLIPNIIHDEYVVECPSEMGKKVAAKLQECMVEAGKQFCTIIPVKATPVVSTKWEH